MAILQEGTIMAIIFSGGKATAICPSGTLKTLENLQFAGRYTIQVRNTGAQAVTGMLTRKLWDEEDHSNSASEPVTIDAGATVNVSELLHLTVSYLTAGSRTMKFSVTFLAGGVSDTQSDQCSVQIS